MGQGAGAELLLDHGQVRPDRPIGQADPGRDLGPPRAGRVGGEDAPLELAQVVLAARVVIPVPVLDIVRPA